MASKRQAALREYGGTGLLEMNRIRWQSERLFHQPDMEYYPTFKHWFGHSGFVAAGHLEGSGIVLGQVIADKRHKRHKEERCVIVDWGAKFPLICKLEMRQGGKDEHIRKPNLRE